MWQARFLILFFCASSVTWAQSQVKKPNFPTNEEIELAVSQAERAFDQYDHSIMLEASLPSMQADKTATDRDRQLEKSARTILAGLKKNPNAFHGPGGLLLLGILDDASRNAALCEGSAFAEIGDGLMAEKGLARAKAYEFMQVGQACMDVSVQLYTVSENVHALLLRELEGQQMVNQQAMETLNRCTAALKAMKEPQTANPKQQPQ